MLPRLHVVTDDAILARPDFAAQAASVLEADRGAIALHLRGHATPTGRLHAMASELAGTGPIFVNDRLDVALAVGVAGVQLGVRSVTIRHARALLGDDAWIGYSAHSVDDAVTAADAGADFVFLGAVWTTPSHPTRPPLGLSALTEAAARAGVPVLAIGGVTPERTNEALEAGAYGVAAISGIWGVHDPVDAALKYLALLRRFESRTARATLGAVSYQ